MCLFFWRKGLVVLRFLKGVYNIKKKTVSGVGDGGSLEKF